MVDLILLDVSECMYFFMWFVWENGSRKSTRIGLVVMVEIDVRGFYMFDPRCRQYTHKKKNGFKKCRSRRWQRVGVVPGSDRNGGCDFMAIFKLRWVSNYAKIVKYYCVCIWFDLMNGNEIIEKFQIQFNFFLF